MSNRKPPLRAAELRDLPPKDTNMSHPEIATYLERPKLDKHNLVAYLYEKGGEARFSAIQKKNPGLPYIHGRSLNALSDDGKISVHDNDDDTRDIRLTGEPTNNTPKHEDPKPVRDPKPAPATNGHPVSKDLTFAGAPDLANQINKAVRAAQVTSPAEVEQKLRFLRKLLLTHGPEAAGKAFEAYEQIEARLRGQG